MRALNGRSVRCAGNALIISWYSANAICVMCAVVHEPTPTIREQLLLNGCADVMRRRYSRTHYPPPDPGRTAPPICPDFDSRWAQVCTRPTLSWLRAANIAAECERAGLIGAPLLFSGALDSRARSFWIESQSRSRFARDIFDPNQFPISLN